VATVSFDIAVIAISSAASIPGQVSLMA